MTNVTTDVSEREKEYALLLKQLRALIAEETEEITILANSSALLNQYLEKVNWVGFYIWKKDQLILGPFQGLPACNPIAYGKGVCGSAVKEEKTLLVPDVNAFPGHIVCDDASKSEIVIPIFSGGEIYGVLDIDSPVKERFDEIDQKYLEEYVSIVEEYL